MTTETNTMLVTEIPVGKTPESVGKDLANLDFRFQSIMWASKAATGIAAMSVMRPELIMKASQTSKVYKAGGPEDWVREGQVVYSKIAIALAAAAIPEALP
jgi:hypothetical protein